MDTSEVTEARFLFVINFSYLSLWRIARLSAVNTFTEQTFLQKTETKKNKRQNPFSGDTILWGKKKKAKNFDGINRSCTLLIK